MTEAANIQRLYTRVGFAPNDAIANRVSDYKIIFYGTTCLKLWDFCYTVSV